MGIDADLEASNDLDSTNTSDGCDSALRVGLAGNVTLPVVTEG
jgi:hypothetical protein